MLSQTLSSKLHTEGQRLIAFFETLRDADWDTIVYAEGAPWTVRHLLAHLVTSERELVRLFKRIQQGHPGVPQTFSIDDANASLQKETESLSPTELLEQYKTVRAETVHWVQTLTEADLAREGRHPFLGQTTLREMIKMLSIHAHLHWRDVKHALHKA